MIIKKIGVIIFSLIFVTTLSLIPVKADEIVSTEIDTYSPTLTEEEQKEIIGAKYLLEYLRQGGSIDLSNKSSGYTAIDLIDDIADFFNGTLAQALGDEGYWINNISETQVPEYIKLKEPKITSEVNMMFGLLPFLVTDSDTPTVQPDVNYSRQLDIINGNGFQYIADLQNDYYSSNIGDIYYWQIYPPTELSYFYISYQPYGYTPEYVNIGSSWEVITAPISTINIIGEGNTYTVNYAYTSINAFASGINYLGNYTPSNHARLWHENHSDWCTSVYNPVNTWTGTYTGTLEQCLNNVALNCKHVNIYVNGVCWSYVSGTTSHIDLGQGTYIENTNQPIQYDTPEGTQIDLTDLIDRLNILIANQNKIKFPDLSDLIVDEDGQQAFAVVVVNKDLTVDDWYVTNYGTLIPLFPVFVDYPVSMTDITTIATVGVKDVIPSDILEVLGIALVGMLFVTWIHRLLE